MTERTCPVCGVVFTPAPGGHKARYCTQRCAARAWYCKTRNLPLSPATRADAEHPSKSIDEMDLDELIADQAKDDHYKSWSNGKTVSLDQKWETDTEPWDPHYDEWADPTALEALGSDPTGEAVTG